MWERLRRLYALVKAILRARKNGGVVFLRGIDRREFLQLMSAGSAMLALPGAGAAVLHETGVNKNLDAIIWTSRYTCRDTLIVVHKETWKLVEAVWKVDVKNSATMYGTVFVFADEVPDAACRIIEEAAEQDTEPDCRDLGLYYMKDLRS